MLLFAVVQHGLCCVFDQSCFVAVAVFMVFRCPCSVHLIIFKVSKQLGEGLQLKISQEIFCQISMTSGYFWHNADFAFVCIQHLGQAHAHTIPCIVGGFQYSQGLFF